MPGRRVPGPQVELYKACENGDSETVRRLLFEGSVVVDFTHALLHQTALAAACESGHADCARLLLQHHASVDHTNNGNGTALFNACTEGHVDCARLLLEYNADVRIATYCGSTPMMAASLRGHVGCATLLFTNGGSASSTIAASRLMAVAMGTHGRVGRASWLYVLPANVLEKVVVHWMMAEAVLVPGFLWDYSFWIADDDPEVLKGDPDLVPTSSSKVHVHELIHPALAAALDAKFSVSPPPHLSFTREELDALQLPTLRLDHYIRQANGCYLFYPVHALI